MQVVPGRTQGDTEKHWWSQPYAEIVAINLCFIAVTAVAVFVSHHQLTLIWAVPASFAGTCMYYKLDWETPTVIIVLAIYTALAVLAILYLKTYIMPLEAWAPIVVVTFVGMRQSGGRF